ncbi:MAG: glycosyltransferase [Candidatus Woesearchaeota archaeon]
MGVSVGVIAYNEEQNIHNILRDLLDQTAKIDEIIVVSSGSTDGTDSKVRQVSGQNEKITLVCEKERKGKASAINQFLKKASGEVVVVSSADLRLEKNTIQELLKPFQEKNVGIVSSHPVPSANKNRILGKTIELQWRLHHEISKKEPKFGELLAFRNIIKEIPNTSVDEESIARQVIAQGFLACYAQEAIVHNKGPETVTDFILQRRRIYCGHLELKKVHGYKASSMSTIGILKALPRSTKPREAGYLAAAAMLELFARALGAIDYYNNKEKHYMWDIANTTKEFSNA